MALDWTLEPHESLSIFTYTFLLFTLVVCINFCLWRLSICPGALTLPETCLTSAAALLSPTCLSKVWKQSWNKPVFLNSHVWNPERVTLWLQASRTVPSRSHSFHFLRSKARGQQGQVQSLLMCGLVCFNWPVVFTRASMLFVEVMV